MRISAFLGKLFNIRSGEWSRLLLLYSMSLVALTGINWGEAIVQAAFLQRVGVQYLPWVFISSAACSFGALFLYTAFADRVSNTRLLVAILGISAAGILIGLAGLAGGLVGPAYLFLYLVLNVPLLDVYNVHWATYVNGFYDIRSAKRIVPVLSTAARLAGIIAGLSMPLINRLLSPAGIIVVWLLMLILMAALAVAMPVILREQRAGAPASGWRGLTVLPSMGFTTAAPVVSQPVPISAHAANLREGYQQIARSPFLRWMALSTLFMTTLLVLLNYQASRIFAEQLKTTVAISDYLGVLSGAANLVVLPFQLLLLSRLIARLGLGSASLVYPLASLAAASGLAGIPGLSTAALAYLDRTALRTAFRNPTENLLFNAVPQRVKARARAFVSGLIIPIGTILSGLLLLTPLVHLPSFLPAMVIILGLSFAAAGWMVRHHYGQAVVSLLEQEDFSSLDASAPQEPVSLALADAATLARLAKKLNESTSPERAIFMAQLIVSVGDAAALPILGKAAREAVDSQLRASITDVLAAAGTRWSGARELYTSFLADPDPAVRLSAIGGLEQIHGPRDARYLQAAAGLLTDPVIEIRLRVLPALLTASDPVLRSTGTRALRELLNAPLPHIRARAIEVIGQAHSSAFLPETARMLVNGTDEVRLAVALVIEVLAREALPAGKREMLLAVALVLLHDPIQRARLAAVTTLALLTKDSSPYGSAAQKALFKALADPSPEVQHAAVNALVGAGVRIIPQAQDLLACPDPQQRRLAAVVLARVQPRRFRRLVSGPILSDLVMLIYNNLCSLQALAGWPGSAARLLEWNLQEQNAALLDEIYYLLSAVQNPAVLQNVADALRSQKPEVRANAAEALESMTNPQAAALLAPLLSQETPSTQHLALAGQTWNMAAPSAASALSLILSNPAARTFQRTLAAAAILDRKRMLPASTDKALDELIQLARSDADPGLREAVEALISIEQNQTEQPVTLSIVGKLLQLKESPFFQSMSTDQLHMLASACEVAFYPVQTWLFHAGDPGGVLFLLVRGQVGIEQEKRPGLSARLAVLEAPACLGENDFFDNNCRTNSAVALQDTLTLNLSREPVLALACQNPDFSLKLINVLSTHLRENSERLAELARPLPRQLHRLFDALE